MDCKAWKAILHLLYAKNRLSISLKRALQVRQYYFKKPPKLKKILDLTRKENAHALYRVSWIFSQPNLMTLVLNTQMQPKNDSYSTFNVDKSLNSSASKMEENSILAKELLRNTADARKNILNALEVKI